MLNNATSLSAFLRNVLVVSVLTVTLAACGGTKWGFPYRADVQQGNWITSEQVSMLRKGMTREQVRFVLGTPTLQDVFHADRWDYPYFHKPGYGEPQTRRFTVWFENNVLVRWEGDQQPDRQPFQRADTGISQEDDTSNANDTETSVNEAANASDANDDSAQGGQPTTVTSPVIIGTQPSVITQEQPPVIGEQMGQSSAEPLR